MIEELKKCRLCPKNCNANRLEGKLGSCKLDGKIRIALASLHYFEEPCISGKEGSGTVFFSGCNLNCMFCQNHEISQTQKGKIVTIEELAQIFLDQQEKGALNINLVTPTMYVYQIREALKLAKEKGLTIPIVYNTNGYEKVETLKLLEGYVDIYLPDFKYYSNTLAVRYSNAPNYWEVVTKALKEMERQVGQTKINANGIMEKGMIIRHLVLPNYLLNSKCILKWIKENMSSHVWVSLMAQYFPTYLAKEDPFINRKLTKEEYEEIQTYFVNLAFENGYIQELGEHEEEYVPNFKW